MASSRPGWRPPALPYDRLGARRCGWTKSPRCKLSPMTEMCCCSATYEQSISLSLGACRWCSGVVDHEEDEVFGAGVGDAVLLGEQHAAARQDRFPLPSRPPSANPLTAKARAAVRAGGRAFIRRHMCCDFRAGCPTQPCAQLILRYSTDSD